jgi:hypothetical protein
MPKQAFGLKPAILGSEETARDFRLLRGDPDSGRAPDGIVRCHRRRNEERSRNDRDEHDFADGQLQQMPSAN